MVQVHMMAKEVQMASLGAINTFLKDVDLALILISKVIDEMLTFHEAWRHLEQEAGPNSFP